jgi:hypothetical protein
MDSPTPTINAEGDITNGFTNSRQLTPKAASQGIYQLLTINAEARLTIGFPNS